ncbi:PAS domain-containing sensor histidine kinase [Dictyobacter arantiisoli]|uniref:histidine kinase n=1 Tax=Dictyobacter arantiisoli TaxID=2014874 RepID=A0A5A5TB79_9CHLR|nr:PAS domain-containing sensor histidine kinase [Dictyobacter arantiisoli]GCF08750.1 hypothetical protein KDI_23140 [Dictyobacter arantiisoli]
MDPHHHYTAARNATQPTQTPPTTCDQRTAEARFMALVEDSADICWLLHTDGTCTNEFTPGEARLHGTYRYQREGHDWLDSIHPQDRTAVVETLFQVIDTKQPDTLTCHIQNQNGLYRPFQLRYVPIYTQSQEVAEIIAYGIDITEQQQQRQEQEEEQRASAKKMATILDSMRDAFFTVDSQWRYTYINTQAQQLLGKSSTELLGKSLTQTTLDLFDAFFLRKLREAQNKQQASHFEVFAQTRKKWLEVQIHPVVDGFSILIQDITERKNIERALRESELKFRRFVESNIIGILIADIYGNIYEANDAYLNLTGYTLAELKARKLRWTTLTPANFLPRQAEAIVEFLSTGVSQPYETAIQHKNGSLMPIMMGMAQLKTSSTQVVAVVLDISDRKEVEHQKDVFIGMTSHELRTPLTIIKGTLQMIQRRMKRLENAEETPSLEALRSINEKNAEDISHALRQIDVQVRLVNDLLDISRIAVNKLELTCERCDLINIIRETVEDQCSTAPQRSLLLELPPLEHLFVQADANRIGQVINNYVTNALKYSVPESPIKIGLTINDGYARVWVKDEGPGLSKEAQKNIWNRFYQIKQSTATSDGIQGLGLGLYICQIIIQLHHGQVGVESTPGQGSTFWFTLPLEEQNEQTG